MNINFEKVQQMSQSFAIGKHSNFPFTSHISLEILEIFKNKKKKTLSLHLQLLEYVSLGTEGER